ncbi:pyridoxal-dependent decarboxylase, partial [Clavibacter michiganensis subsp. insidiosus]
MTLSPHASRPSDPTLDDPRADPRAEGADPAPELFSDRSLPGWDAALRAAAAHVRSAARR